MKYFNAAALSLLLGASLTSTSPTPPEPAHPTSPARLDARQVKQDGLVAFDPDDKASFKPEEAYSPGVPAANNPAAAAAAPKQPPIKYVYRVDSRSLHQIQQIGGFLPWVTSPSNPYAYGLWHHINWYTDLDGDASKPHSQYVSTSESFVVVADMAAKQMGPHVKDKKPVWIHKIHVAANMVDASHVLQTVYETAEEFEVSALGGIFASQIESSVRVPEGYNWQTVVGRSDVESPRTLMKASGGKIPETILQKNPQPAGKPKLPPKKKKGKPAGEASPEHEQATVETWTPDELFDNLVQRVVKGFQNSPEGETLGENPGYQVNADYDSKWNEQTITEGQPQLAGFDDGLPIWDKEPWAQYSTEKTGKDVKKHAFEFMEKLGPKVNWPGNFPLFSENAPEEQEKIKKKQEEELAKKTEAKKVIQGVTKRAVDTLKEVSASSGMTDGMKKVIGVTATAAGGLLFGGLLTAGVAAGAGGGAVAAGGAGVGGASLARAAATLGYEVQPLLDAMKINAVSETEAISALNTKAGNEIAVKAALHSAPKPPTGIPGQGLDAVVALLSKRVNAFAFARLRPRASMEPKTAEEQWVIKALGPSAARGLQAVFEAAVKEVRQELGL
ncbi:hypothetical protein MANI_024598 [Metarhizium anisopliae]